MVRRNVIYLACAYLALMLVLRFRGLGGPYFAFPQTIQDHVNVVPYPSRDAIVLCEFARTIIPIDKSVTVLKPSEAPNYDPTLFYTATGFMPRHNIVAPQLDSEHPPDFVISIGEPMNHPRYRLFVQHEKGFIYSLQ